MGNQSKANHKHKVDSLAVLNIVKVMEHRPKGEKGVLRLL